MLTRFRQHAGVLARVNLALFALVWIAAVSAPCAMAMHADPVDSGAHDCPHCPPRPCHDVAPDDCESPALDSLIAVEKTLSVAVPAPSPHTALPVRPQAAGAMPASRGNAPRAGPRAHLLHAQFNE